MNQVYQCGDKLMTKSGSKVIFEEYDNADMTICFVIPDPDLYAEGSRRIRVSTLNMRVENERRYDSCTKIISRHTLAIW